MPKVRFQLPEDLMNRSGGKYDDVDYVNGGLLEKVNKIAEEKIKEGYEVKETDGGLLPLLAISAVSKLAPTIFKTAKSFAPSAISAAKSMGKEVATGYRQQLISSLGPGQRPSFAQPPQQYRPPPQQYRPPRQYGPQYRGGKFSSLAKSVGQQVVKGVKAMPEYQQAKLIGKSATQRALSSQYGQLASALAADPQAVQHLTQQAIGRIAADPRARQFAQKAQKYSAIAQDPRAVEHLTQRAVSRAVGSPQAGQFSQQASSLAQPTFRPGQFKMPQIRIRGGDDVSQKLVESDVQEVQTNPQGLEEMKISASQAIDAATSKAQTSYAKTVDAAKIEPELIPKPVVKTIKIPVKVAGLVRGGEPMGVWITILVIIGIITLLYLVYILFQPSLTGRWGDPSGRNFIDINYNRFTKNISLVSARPITHVGVQDIFVMSGKSRGYLAGTTIKIKYRGSRGKTMIPLGKWDRKNMIVMGTFGKSQQKGKGGSQYPSIYRRIQRG